MFKWLFYVFVNIPFMLVAYLVTPLLPLFVGEDGTLPPYLKWFETWDARHLFFDGTGEIQSDWLQIHWLFLKPIESIPWLHLYLCRVLWLYRNCGYGFAYYVCGKEYIQEDVISTIKTNEDGLLKIEMWVGDLFRRSGFIPYSIFNNNLGFDYYLGWKLQAADDCPTGKPIKAMIAMRINPLKGK